MPDLYGTGTQKRHFLEWETLERAGGGTLGEMVAHSGVSRQGWGVAGEEVGARRCQKVEASASSGQRTPEETHITGVLHIKGMFAPYSTRRRR